MCSDVDRYFRLSFNVDIFKQINEDDFSRITTIFPNFKKITFEQFNRLLATFTSIRDISAHLFLNKPIELDADIEEFILSMIEAKYKLECDKEITLFGTLCVVVLFSQNYQLWTLITSIIRRNIMRDINKEQIADEQRNFMEYMRVLLGKGKPCLPEDYSFFTKVDITFINEEVKKRLTRLIFNIEKYSMKEPKTTSNAKAFKQLLRKYKCLHNKPELMDKINELRNTWLHGYRFFDEIEKDDQKYIFDFKYLFDILFEIKKTFERKHGRGIIRDIDVLGSDMIDFFTLRSVEITFKILDKKIFDKEKIRKRIDNSLMAYSHCMSVEPWFYNSASKLLSNKKTWYLTANKFLDFKIRTLKADYLEFFEFSSDSGFDFDDIHIDKNEMILTNIDCSIDDQLKINGKYLSEYITESMETYGVFKIYKVKL